ncbi:ABC transporter permease [Cohnella terricola]|uniref:ABC transporter permease n=1 Tax=Cohnella terricola TaxID=1289167 RepID=A0A559JWI1_9BACL|nr:ABC transporter permease [Cohnella terricola]TVY04239.1 ABC transporter permease [Cohnella terricola]
MMEKKKSSYEIQAAEEGTILPLHSLWRGLRANKLAMAGLTVLVFFIAIAIFAPLITPYAYDQGDLLNTNRPPSYKHWFGTDYGGRDIYTRIVYGARLSLWVGLASVLISVSVGSVMGLLAGYYGRWIDMLNSRLFDILLAFPSILLAIAIVAMLGPSLQNALLSIAIVNVPTFGRLIRSKVVSLKEEDFILAAKSIGMKDRRILFLHILPNCLTPIIVTGTMAIGTAILEAAALGFLGMGAQPPQPEWGKMLADSKDYLLKAPWTVLFPGLSIMLAVIGFNLVGDGLRDISDPRMKRG